MKNNCHLGVCLLPSKHMNSHQAPPSFTDRLPAAHYASYFQSDTAFSVCPYLHDAQTGQYMQDVVLSRVEAVTFRAHLFSSSWLPSMAHSSTIVTFSRIKALASILLTYEEEWKVSPLIFFWVYLLLWLLVCKSIDSLWLGKAQFERFLVLNWSL